LPIVGIAAVEAFRRREDRQRFPPPGRLIDMGGYRLHLTVVSVSQRVLYTVRRHAA